MISGFALFSCSCSSRTSSRRRPTTATASARARRRPACSCFRLDRVALRRPARGIVGRHLGSKWPLAARDADHGIAALCFATTHDEPCTCSRQRAARLGVGAAFAAMAALIADDVDAIEMGVASGMNTVVRWSARDRRPGRRRAADRADDRQLLDSGRVGIHDHVRGQRRRRARSCRNRGLDRPAAVPAAARAGPKPSGSHSSCGRREVILAADARSARRTTDFRPLADVPGTSWSARLMHHTGGEPTDDRDPEQHQDHPARARPAAARAPGSTATSSPPATTDWDDARLAWNLAVDQRPALPSRFPSPPTTSSPSSTSRATHGLRVAPQGTGHNAAPLGALDGHDPAQDRTACAASTIDPDAAIARVEAGALWIEVVEAAAEHGLAALAGSSPDVGVVGYTLGGGLGWLAPQHGLGANSVTRDRARHRRRRASSAPTARRRARPVLGAARRRRQLRRRHRDRVRPLPDHARSTPGSSGPGRARRRGARRLARVDRGRSRTSSPRRPHPPVPADPGDPGAAARPLVRGRRGALRRRRGGRRPRCSRRSARSAR